MIFFFFNDTATTEIYTLSLHDALPIYRRRPIDGPARGASRGEAGGRSDRCRGRAGMTVATRRSEEHTSELQSRQYLVCRLLLEKKKTLYCSTSSTASFHASLLVCVPLS